MRRLSWAALPRLAAILLLSACGGAGDNAMPSAGGPTPQRGALLQSPPTKLSSHSIADLLAKLANSDTGKLLLQLPFTPKCAIDVYALQYQTVGALAEATTASAALMAPSGSIGPCAGAHPILLYAPVFLHRQEQ